MDTDAFSAVHGEEWARLDRLARRRRLSGAEADELVRLYRATATHLSTVQSAAPEPVLVGRLSTILARARARITGSPEPSWSDLGRFVVVTLPAALYRVRWWTAAVALAFLLVAGVTGFWVATHPEARALLGTPEELQQYADEAFEAYYSSGPAPSFAAQVWTNNAWIAAQCVGLGITGALPVYVLAQNAIAVGAAAGVMAAYGELGLFFALIAPHGLLELTAIFVAGAAGLRIFWAWVAPGPLPRGRSVAQEGRSLITVAMGLVGVLAVSGLIEAFVTPSALPWAIKASIGVLALAGFVVYALVLGRTAALAGGSADLEEDQAGYVAVTAG